MSRVVHFEIHADDPEEAIRFYSTVFGWKFSKWGMSSVEYWVIKTGDSTVPGIDGGLVKRKAPIDGHGIIGYICTIDVPNINEYLRKVVDNRGQIHQDKQAIPGVGWLAYCTDIEGNIFGLMQTDTSAQ